MLSSEEIAVFHLENDILPNKDNCSIFKHYELLSILDISQNDYSTDSDYEEKHGIRKKYKPIHKMIADSIELKNIFDDIKENKKTAIFKQIMEKITIYDSYNLFFEKMNVTYCIVKLRENIKLDGVFKEMSKRTLNFYFRREAYKLKNNPSSNYKFYNGRTAYDCVFSYCNEIYEYNNVILDTKYETLSLGMYAIIDTRNIWIDALREKHNDGNKIMHYDYLD